jgi:membrane-bound lytic murein transglycosylase D
VPEAKRNAWRYHRVAADDTLASVAREFHVTEPELAAANQLRSNDSIQGVEALVVPLAPVAASSRMLLYTARKGDTLVTIADRFGVSLTQLRRWNKMTGTRVGPGSRLHVAEPSIASHAAAATGRSPRRGKTASSSEKAPQAATAKGSAHKPVARSSKKAATSANATRSAASNAKGKQAGKQPAHAKSSTQ